MKSHVRHSLLALALLTSTLPVSAQETTVTSAAITLPDLNPADWFDGKMGGTFGAKTVTAFAKSNRVAIAGFRVVFVTHDEARSISRASYLPGRDMGTAKSRMEVDLQGVDEATMQKITDQAYQQFVAQLKSIGREVVPVDEMQPSFAGFKLATTKDVSTGLLKGKAFTPAGLPLWWQIGEGWGDAGLGQKNMRAFNELSKNVKAPVTIAPMIVINFAQMSGSGNHSSLINRHAETGTTLSMTVPTFYTRVVRAEETRYGGIVFKGDDGALALKQALDTDVEFATLENVGTKRSSYADTKSVVKYNVAKTDNESYMAASQAVLSQAVGTFVKLFATNPAK
jgi:hypothetical protein